MNVVVFGTGLYYQNRKEKLKQKDITVVSFWDNNGEKWGMELDGMAIQPPQKDIAEQYDYILLMSKDTNHAEMKSQLLSLGIEEKKIISFADIENLQCKSEQSPLADLRNIIQQDGCSCRSGKDIFRYYDYLKEIIDNAEGLSDSEEQELKQLCKNKLINGMNQIFLENFWA